jgi:hypothetical protein
MIPDFRDRQYPWFIGDGSNFRRVGHEGESASLVLEVSHLPDANNLGLWEEVNSIAERYLLEEFKLSSSLFAVPDIEDCPLVRLGTEIEEFIAVYRTDSLLINFSVEGEMMLDLAFLVVDVYVTDLSSDFRCDHSYAVFLHKDGMLKVSNWRVESELDVVFEKHVDYK